ncbi:hypothetical protein [Blastopirellula marina]|uniref:Uncharacterized protein n=1 Tax=Blastopirellula marina DSM 3645 TaxID=314230 RepID=A3ZR29_9BACT|nr:hypothetical protein [Blastopirellula marina]EAQ81122.1 hypothetical protein DSM3645_21162 [Blastopirellula marina DSM 3645]
MSACRSTSVGSSLVRREKITPAIAALASRHHDYGVKAEDYQPVGAALLGRSTKVWRCVHAGNE